MKIKILIGLIVVLVTGAHGISSGKESGKKGIKPELIDSASYLYKAGNIYLAGQPSKKNFSDLKNKGLTLVINLRTDEEIKENTAKNYDEEAFLKAEGIGYFHISVSGTGKYDPKVVDIIAEKIKSSEGKVMIHCRSAGRATFVWMAWLVRYQHYPVNKAVKLGKMARYSFPFEELLGMPVVLKVKAQPH